MKTRNPKMAGTVLVDAVPQAGKCPLNCRACYFNLGFYRDVPFVPTPKEAKGKIVRVCSGNDANNDRKTVIAATEHLADKFFCTAIGEFDFPGPAVFTCNRDENAPPTLANPKEAVGLMSVRFRYAPWNADYLRDAVEYYCVGLGVPLLITPMRYYDANDIPAEFLGLYVFKKHLVHSYYMLRAEVDGSLREQDWGHRLAYVCAGLCRECLLCVHFYHQARANVTEGAWR